MSDSKYHTLRCGWLCSWHGPGTDLARRTSIEAWGLDPGQGFFLRLRSVPPGFQSRLCHLRAVSAPRACPPPPPSPALSRCPPGCSSRADAQQNLSPLALPRPVPRAPGAEGDGLGTWGLDGGWGRALSRILMHLGSWGAPLPPPKVCQPPHQGVEIGCRRLEPQ